MVLASAAFGTMWAFARAAGAHDHPLVTVFFRFLFGFVFMLPWLVRTGGGGFGTRRPLLHLTNAVAQVLATAAVFYGVTVIPLAEVGALTFTSPLFATAGAALFLGERVGVRRWGAALIGFIGALMVLRPDFNATNIAAFVVLAGSACAACGTLATKALARTDSPNTIVVYLSLGMALMALPAALPVWRTPDLAGLGLMAGAGAMGTLGLLALARSYALADASAVLPLRFFQLVFVAIYGFALFGETPEPVTWIGAIIIFAATVYTSHREAALARARRGALAAGAEARGTTP